MRIMWCNISGVQHASHVQALRTELATCYAYGTTAPAVPSPTVPTCGGSTRAGQPHAQGGLVQPHGGQSLQNVVQQPARQSMLLAGQRQVAPAQMCTDDSLPSEVMHYVLSLKPPLKHLNSRDTSSLY